MKKLLVFLFTLNVGIYSVLVPKILEDYAAQQTQAFARPLAPHPPDLCVGGDVMSLDGGHLFLCVDPERGEWKRFTFDDHELQELRSSPSGGERLVRLRILQYEILRNAYRLRRAALEAQGNRRARDPFAAP